MPTLSVGSLYHPARTSWPECSQYNYRAGAHELLLFLHRPSEDEVAAIRTGESEFALYVSGLVILLLYRFGSAIQWSDAPYSWHLVPTDEQDLPSADLEGGKRALLNVILIDASNGKVQGIRALTVSSAFTRKVHSAIREQAEGPWDPTGYQRELDQLYARHTSEQLVQLAMARSKGGA